MLFKYMEKIKMKSSVLTLAVLLGALSFAHADAPAAADEQAVLKPVSAEAAAEQPADEAKKPEAN
jgi:hypothetical protein